MVFRFLAYARCGRLDRTIARRHRRADRPVADRIGRRRDGGRRPLADRANGRLGGPAIAAPGYRFVMTPVLTTALPVMDRARRAIRMVRDTDFLAQADLVAALWRGGPRTRPRRWSRWH